MGVGEVRGGSGGGRGEGRGVMGQVCWLVVIALITLNLGDHLGSPEGGTCQGGLERVVDTFN